jgi:uncharacterized protein YbjT (DUF2867 family)
VGQIQAIQANVRYRWSVRRAIEGSDAVINLIGILKASGKQSFNTIQAEGPGLIAEEAKDAGIDFITHVSAIGADSTSRSAYGRSKAQGEQNVLAALPDSVILRPSIIFGPEDDFFNRFARMAAYSPVLPIVRGKTRFQPVYVGDVAKAVCMAAEGKVKKGQIYELGCPDIRTFRELMELMLEIIGRNRTIVDIPASVAQFPAKILQYLPNAPLTVDQVHMLTKDNIVSAKALSENRTFEAFGLEPNGLASVLPSYLWPYRDKGQWGAASVDKHTTGLEG